MRQDLFIRRCQSKGIIRPYCTLFQSICCNKKREEYTKVKIMNRSRADGIMETEFSDGNDIIIGVFLSYKHFNMILKVVLSWSNDVTSLLVMEVEKSNHQHGSCKACV